MVVEIKVCTAQSKSCACGKEDERTHSDGMNVVALELGDIGSTNSMSLELVNIDDAGLFGVRSSSRAREERQRSTHLLIIAAAAIIDRSASHDDRKRVSRAGSTSPELIQ